MKGVVAGLSGCGGGGLPTCGSQRVGSAGGSLKASASLGDKSAGAKTPAAPAAAPILSTLRLLIVPSIFSSISGRSFACVLGIESPFSRFGVASIEKVVCCLSYDRDPKLPVLVQLLGKDDQFDRRGLC